MSKIIRTINIDENVWFGVKSKLAKKRKSISKEIEKTMVKWLR